MSRRSRKKQQNKVVKAKYDAAGFSRQTVEHWKEADSLSAVSSNSPDVRKKLRERCRYEVANNSFARGIEEVIANDLVGSGARLQVVSDNRELARKIEEEFSTWCKEVGLHEIHRTKRRAEFHDGESFTVLSSLEELPTPVKLALVLVESDQVSAGGVSEYNAMYFGDGVEVDNFNRPIKYRILKAHPGGPLGGSFYSASSGDFSQRKTETLGGGGGSGSNLFDDYDAKYVIHCFKCSRPGQLRGIPEITAALPLFAQLRRYTLSVLTASESAADMATFIKSNNQDAYNDEAPTAFQQRKIPRGMLTVLPENWDIGQLDAKQPTTTYPQFKAEVLKEVARCANVPFYIAAGDTSGLNYYPAQMEAQIYMRKIDVERSVDEVKWLSRIYRAWLKEAVLLNGYLPAGAKEYASQSSKHTWRWPAFVHIDPVKEAEAARIRLSTRTTTLATEKKNGESDWEEMLEQQKIEEDRIKELGLTSPYLTQAAPDPQTPSDPA